MSTPTDRVTSLESRAAEQEREIEELSGQIAEQWQVIDRLRRQVEVLADRFLALEDQTRPDIPVTRPPHW